MAQYAGGIGLFSAGLGWMYGKKQFVETDFLLGYVPPYTTGRGKLTITARETYVPFDIKSVWRREFSAPRGGNVLQCHYRTRVLDERTG